MTTTPGLALLTTYLRLPETIDTTTDPPTYTFVPPLTTAEQAILADLFAMSKSPFTSGMTLAEYQTIKPFLATERAFVQQSQSEFIALAQNARDRALFDAVTALIRVQRQMMRDG